MKRTYKAYDVNGNYLGIKTMQTIGYVKTGYGDRKVWCELNDDEDKFQYLLQKDEDGYYFILNSID